MAVHWGGRGVGHNSRWAKAASNLHPDAQAIFDAMASPPSAGEMSNINTLLTTLDAAGVWDEISGLWVGVDANAKADTLFNWKNPAQVGTETGTLPFTTDHGVTASATNRIDTGIAVNALVSLNDQMVGIFTATEGQNANAIIANAASTNFRLILRNASNQFGARLGVNTAAISTATMSTAIGLSVAQRINSTTVQFYRNGVKHGNDVSSSSSSVPTDNLCIGVPTTSDSRLINAAFVGSFLTADQHLALYNALMTFAEAAGILLAPLGFSGAMSEGSSSTVNVTGTRTGSTLSVQSGSLPTGMSLDSGARTVSGTPTTAGTGSAVIRETLADRLNTPRDTTWDWTVAVTLDALTLSATEWTTGSPSSGTIDGDTAGSSISVSGALPTGLTIDTTARTWDWDGTGSVSTGSFDLVETHADASNSPRTSTINWGIVDYPSFNDMPAMNDALDTTGRAVLMVIGDSTKDGVGANGLGTMANAYNINATAALAAELALLGFNVSRDCYGFGDHGTNTSTVSALAGYYGNVTIPSSWSIGGIASPWGANACYKTADSEAITITPHLACDTVELFYLQYPGNGDLSVDRGGTAQTVSTNGTHQVGSQQFTFPLGTQDVNIKVASGFAGVFAIRMWNSTTERLVIVDGSCTNGGWTTANLLTNAAMGGSAAANIGRLRADGFIFNYGLNDKYNSRTSSAFQTDLETIINAGLAGDAPNTTLSPDVVIEIPNSCNSSSPADFDATWKACVTNAAINTGIRAPLDLYALFDPWASFSTKFYDDIHPDEEGYADIGAAEAAYL